MLHTRREIYDLREAAGRPSTCEFPHALPARMPQPEAPSPIQSPQTATTATQPTLSLEERIRKQELLTRKNQRAIESINDEEEEAGIDGVELPSELSSRRSAFNSSRSLTS